MAIPEILVIDDERNIRRSVEMILTSAGYEVSEAASSSEAASKLAEKNFDLLLLDIVMPGSELDGLQFLQTLKSLPQRPATIIISGNATIQNAVAATREGAYDFIEKPISKDKLLIAVKNALAQRQLAEENVRLRREVSGQYAMIGASAALEKIRAQISRVAPTHTRVLILGESGTGKELVARAIHDASERARQAFIKVNCAAIPEDLIESELFGHEKGAFTGATARKKGRFELADGGTLLLDEVGELPLETQVKLLRVLQEQEFERVGGAQTLKVNVRVIAATNRHLEEAVQHGAFRADLFYRLNIFPIPLPALRERPEDIPMLAHHFVGKFARRTGKRVERIAPEAMEALRLYHWPGNIREMANILERAVILCDGGTLQKEHIAISPQPAPKPEAALLTLEENERALILKTLAETNWVIGGANGAAQRLGLNRTTLLARMKKLEIERPKE